MGAFPLSLDRITKRAFTKTRSLLRLALFLCTVYPVTSPWARSAVAMNSQEHNLRIDSKTITYRLPSPKRFIESPKTAPKLQKGEGVSVFSAFYEQSLIPDIPLYEVAAALARTHESDIGHQNFGQDAFLSLVRHDPSLKSILKHQSRQTIDIEMVGGNRWMVFRTFEARKKSLIQSVIFARPVGGEYVLVFRLNFWDEKKGVEWRRRRLALLRSIVESVRVSDS